MCSAYLCTVSFSYGKNVSVGSPRHRKTAQVPVDPNISKGSCARERSAKRGLGVAMMPNSEFAQSSPLLWLHPSIDRHMKCVTSQTSHTGLRRAYRQDSIPPPQKRPFSLRSGPVCEGHFCARASGGRVRTCAAAARPSLHCSPSARPHRHIGAHRGPAGSCARPSPGPDPPGEVRGPARP